MIILFQFLLRGQDYLTLIPPPSRGEDKGGGEDVFISLLYTLYGILF
jgi:hypothetical protein